MINTIFKHLFFVFFLRFINYLYNFLKFIISSNRVVAIEIFHYSLIIFLSIQCILIRIIRIVILISYFILSCIKCLKIRIILAVSQTASSNSFESILHLKGWALNSIFVFVLVMEVQSVLSRIIILITWLFIALF